MIFIALKIPVKIKRGNVIGVVRAVKVKAPLGRCLTTSTVPATRPSRSGVMLGLVSTGKQAASKRLTSVKFFKIFIVALKLKCQVG